MSRETFLSLAAAGHRAPIGTHLVLHEQPDVDAVLHDGDALGSVIIETAGRFRTPLAVPLMDLKIEKEAILTALGIPAASIDGFHFEELPPDVGAIGHTPRTRATCDAIARVARESSLLPMGMCIGPFSLMTKMLSDPITPIYMVGAGADPEDDEDVEIAQKCLDTGLRFILQHINNQIDAGARAMFVCEPAANMVYFSPKQLAESFDVFDRFVMHGLREITALLERRGVDLILHDCGELTDGMVERFGALRPAMLSLGCSRQLWHDATLLPKDVVLYGNLPSKRFYSSELTPEHVRQASRELALQMRAASHPFILGSECDILSVDGMLGEITAKIDAFMGVDIPAGAI